MNDFSNMKNRVELRNLANLQSNRRNRMFFNLMARFSLFSRCSLWVSVVAVIFIHVSAFGQDLSSPGAAKKFYEYKQSVLAKKKKIGPKTPLDEILTIYTDMGKIYTVEKKYSTALIYLLKAKKLNKNNQSNYSHYNVALGALFKEIHANSVAIEFFKKEIHREDHLNNYFQIASVGSLYLRLSDYENAEFYFKMQLEEAKLMNDYIAVASAKNNIGISLLKANKVDEAIDYFSQSIDDLNKNKHQISPNFQWEYTSLMSNVCDNLGQSYKIKNQPAMALSHLNMAYDLLEDKATNPPFRLMLLQANTYIMLNQLVEAHDLIQSIDVNRLSLANKIEYYSTVKNFNLVSGNYKELALNLKKIEALCDEKERQNVMSNDLMNQLVSKLLVSESLDRIDFEKKKKEALIKQHSFERRKNLATIVIIVVICLIVLSFLLLILQRNKNKRKKIELEKQLLELEEEKLNQKLNVQNNHLTDFAIEKRVKDLKSKELLSNLQELKKNTPENILNAINQLIHEIKQDDLNSQMSHVHQMNDAAELLLLEFKLKLQEKHPYLSETDLILCQLIRLKLSNKEIANFKNITLESVKIAKNRLKKKLNIDADVNVTSYISQF